MASRWEKPGFKVVRVAGECTAYSGAEAVEPRPSTATTGREPARSPHPGPARSDVKAPAAG